MCDSLSILLHRRSGLKGIGEGKQNKAGHILFCLAEMLQAHADGSGVDPAAVSFVWGTGEPRAISPPDLQQSPALHLGLSSAEVRV